MFLKKLKTTSLLTIIVYVLFAALFCCLPAFNNRISDLYSDASFLPITIFILGIILPLLQSIGLNNLIYEKDVIKKNSLVVAPVFLLLCTPFISHPDAWIVSFLLLFYLNILFSGFQKERPFALGFNSNFLLGSITLFYSNIILLFPLIIIVFLTFRNLSWRSVLISLIGLTLPILLFFTFSFIFEFSFVYSLPKYKLMMPTLSSIKTLTYAQLFWGLLVSIIFIFSITELILWMYKKSIRSRKSFLIIIAYFILLLFIDFENTYYLVVTPIAIIIANFFVYSKRTQLTEILFSLFILTSIYYRISI